MMDYQIQPNSRKCAVSGRPLEPGESYYSALMDQDGRFVRKDYSREQWHGPPEAAFSFWKGTVPTSDKKPRPRFDDELLMDCFQRLDGQSDESRVNFRYIVALLLLRRKRLKLVDAADGEEKMQVACVKTHTKYDVIHPQLSDDDLASVQEEVFHVLGWE